MTQSNSSLFLSSRIRIALCLKKKIQFQTNKPYFTLKTFTFFAIAREERSLEKTRSDPGI